LMPCLMPSFADAWVVLLQAHKSQLQRATAQLTEKQCVVEVKQAEIGKLEDCLIASQQEVAAVHQEHASAVQAHSDAAQVRNCHISTGCLADALHLHMSLQQFFSWYICSTLPYSGAIMLDIQKAAGL